MPVLLTIDDIGAADVRDMILRAVDSAVDERQSGFKAAAPRRRAVLHDERIASALFEAVRDRLGAVDEWPVSDALRDVEPPLTGWRFSRVDAFLRVYRYSRGESFSTHQDEERNLPSGERTALTLLLYLPGDDTPTGGETFVDGQPIEPRPWRLAVFAHHSWHHGAEVMRGTKAVLRADVVIAPPP